MIPHRASLIRRGMAFAIDKFIIEGVVLLAFTLYFSATSESQLVLIQAVIQGSCVIYWTALEYMHGQSLGKILMGLKTISTKNKARMSFYEAFVRSLPKAFDSLLVIDCIPLFMGPSGRRIGEIISGTGVVDWNE